MAWKKHYGEERCPEVIVAVAVVVEFSEGEI
jgi:hypothetical protein